MDLSDLTGYSLRRRLGPGSAGVEAWQVRDRASGRNAVLKRIPISAVPDPRRLREDLSMLSRLRHPHIARVVEFRETETDLLVISQYVPAGSLARLLRRRGPLSRGELVTLLVPLAEAVDHLHRANLTHGSITPHNVVLDADGRPVLTDATLRPAPPVADLHALITLSHQAGADPTVFTADLFLKTPSNALPGQLLSLAAPVPIELAVPTEPASISAVPPDSTPKSSDDTPGDDDPMALSRAPLAPPPTKPPTTPPTLVDRPTQSLTARGGSKRTRPKRRTRSRRTLRRLPQPPRLTHPRLPRLSHLPYGAFAAAGLGIVIVLALAIATLRALDTPATAQADPIHPQSVRPQSTSPQTTHPQTTQAQSAHPQPTRVQPTGVAATPSEDPAAWTRTLEALDAQRAQAFWTLDLTALDRIYVPGSSPWRADHALLSSYRKQQIRVQGLRVQIDNSTVAYRTPTTITLKTTDHLTGGQTVDQSGTTTPLPPGAPMTRLITLTSSPTTKAWRITAITRA
ncbi:serine/threonine-protein kinase [Kribbella sp. NPDC051586]|uniref:serine/threonine-protein kinase n=1 Tax=Kribbella sp. NPDC051586 TaxID=3364118 RepID=UPI0037A827CE